MASVALGKILESRIVGVVNSILSIPFWMSVILASLLAVAVLAITAIMTLTFSHMQGSVMRIWGRICGNGGKTITINKSAGIMRSISGWMKNKK